ncbi:16S rRNA (guanine(527)-N(7))-methyltransferase RsmG [Acidiphilium acidophilum]|uniref:16S rRNA (guanine(527)-N(7))-methyltransferase RsmG n=1 Tax=Acidiphilium acidophilum TaxID=76588 RepID=UPI002E8E6E8A|nr:16S rRNA (guanine(527)-N(7))-methyltransferase RsmG [Acidiphilium acidophilum]
MTRIEEKIGDASNVSRETKDAFRTYSAAIRSWTGRINLIARSDATDEAIWERHIADSLQILPLIPDGVDRAVDLGSGAGLPGLVVAIERRDIAVTMIESDRRKAAFLQTMVATLGLRATVRAERIEQVKIVPVPLVTARALAPLPKLLDYAVNFLSPDGVCLFLKGQSVDAELAEAAAQWRMRVERFPSRTAPGSFILRISELQRAA